jgi:pimeloyl-ACP methyl ester carboxylesterase
VRVLRALDGPAVLVGHSLGGVTAWWVAQRHPDLVAGAFLEDPPLYFGEPDQHPRNGALPHFLLLRDAMIRWQAEGMEPEAAAVRIAAAPYGPDPRRKQGEVLTPEAIAARAHALLHADPGVLDAVLDGTALAATDTVSPVPAPVTILAAGATMGAAFLVHHAERLARTHPDVTVMRLDSAGHSIHDERAHRDEYTARLADFLAVVEQRQ